MKNRKIIYGLFMFILFFLGNKLSYLYRHINAKTTLNKINLIGKHFIYVFRWPLISLHKVDIGIGILITLFLAGLIYIKKLEKKNLKSGVEYGSARWGKREDIEPFMDDEPDKNILLTNTEMITISNRGKIPKNSRNNNIMVVGGSGSGKTRFFCKPNLMQLHSSYVVTDPKGTTSVR